MESFLRRGDIADFVCTKEEGNEQTDKVAESLKLENPYKLIVIRAIDEKKYLVVVCKKEKKKTQMEIETNNGFLFIKLARFVVLDSNYLRLCNGFYFLQDKNYIINQIYDAHNKFLEKRKQVKNTKIKEKQKKNDERRKNKREKKLKERFEQKELENKYKGSYETAVISNDKKQMKKIENIVGYVPGLKGPSKGGSGKEKTIYKIYNPHPYSGGSFTPK